MKAFERHQNTFFIFFFFFFFSSPLKIQLSHPQLHMSETQKRFFFYIIMFNLIRICWRQKLFSVEKTQGKAYFWYASTQVFSPAIQKLGFSILGIIYFFSPPNLNSCLDITKSYFYNFARVKRRQEPWIAPIDCGGELRSWASYTMYKPSSLGSNNGCIMQRKRTSYLTEAAEKQET